MKQTAVEFIVEELNKSIGLTKFVDSCDDDYKQEILGIIEQAKEMEKEQIIDAYNNVDNRSADLYYNETFKSE
jgi:hypothetical protein